MSSPPMEFPSSELDDVDMQEAPPTNVQSPHAGSDNPLFLATPTRTPMRNVAARRALGLSTPRRAPVGGVSSPILDFPSSSSPVKSRAGARGPPSSNALQSSDPLHFPS